MRPALADLRAERESLAYALRGFYDSVLAYTAPDEYHAAEHAQIATSVTDLVLDGADVTYATVADHLAKRGVFSVKVEQALERAHTFPLDDDRQASAAEAAAKLVHDKFKQRLFDDRIERVRSELYEGRLSADAAVERVMTDCLDIGVSARSRSQHITALDAGLEARLDRLLSGEMLAFSTTVGALDRALGGIQPGEVAGITGPAGSCKSLLKNRINFAAADAGWGCVSYILEMTAYQEVNRAIAMRSDGRVSAKRFRGGPGLEPPTPDEVALYRQYKAELMRDDYPFWIDDSKFHLSELLADAERRVHENGVRMIAIDYAQLLQVGDGQKRYAELDRISQALRRFALKNECAVVVIVRLNQQGARSALKGEEITGAEIYGSSSFIYDLSSLVALHFDDPMWMCECPAEEQLREDPESGRYQPIHEQGVNGFCSICGREVRSRDRLGHATILKARDGDVRTKVDLLLSGATLSIRELRDRNDPQPTTDAATLVDFHS